MDRVAELLARNKYERVKEMMDFGLNTPDYIYFPHGEWERWYSYADNEGSIISPNHRVSIRFFAAEDILMGTQPHLPHVSWAEARMAISSYLKDYDVMLAVQAIQPNDTVVCGNLMMTLHSTSGYGIATFEYRYGAGTVRDVQKSCTSLTCNLHEFPKDPDTGEFVPGLARAKHAALRFPYWNHVIFEWSFYPYGKNIGWKHQPLIFWECRRKH